MLLPSFRRRRNEGGPTSPEVSGSGRVLCKRPWRQCICALYIGYEIAVILALD
jgi:hypothetical protein